MEAATWPTVHDDAAQVVAAAAVDASSAMPKFTGLAAASGATPAAPADVSTAVVPKISRAKPARRRFISQIPPSIAEDAVLLAALQALPSNYNFEVPKTIWRLRQMGARSVALQFPEGLLLYACTIADIIEQVACEEGECEVVILGDVTYGACCVDDLTAAALGCELLVHYGHSCLVPIDRMATDVMYVFVDVAIDTAHLVDTICLNFGPESRIALCGTIQFSAALHATRAALKGRVAEVQTPQAKPLSAGEVRARWCRTIEQRGRTEGLKPPRVRRGWHGLTGAPVPPHVFD